MKPKFGIIGCGRFGQRYAETLKKLGFEYLTTSRNPDKLDEQWKAENVYTPDLDGLIAFSDIVIVATPPESHYKLAARALEHGRNIILEKPATINAEECYFLNALASLHYKTCQVNYSYLWHPEYKQLCKQLSYTNKQPLFLHSMGFATGPDRDFCVLADWVSHDLALIYNIVGDTKVVDATVTKEHFDGNNGLFKINLKFENKHTALIDCGNRGITRHRSFKVRQGCCRRYQFVNDFKTLLLDLMILEYVEKIKGGQRWTNLDLAERVTRTTQQLEKLL
jgi:predicted dehydrogenase